MDTKTQATAPRSYEDFQPMTDWVQEEKSDTVRLRLPGFKREQLKVQLDNYGNLKISGERPIEASTNKWIRFRQEFRVPNDINFAEIRAKFENATLHVTMPKSTTTPAPTPATAAPSKPTPPTQRAQESEPRTKADGKGDAGPSSSKRQPSRKDKQQRRTGFFAGASLHKRRGELVKKWPLVVSFAVTLMVGLAVGVYLAHKIKIPEGQGD